MTVPCNTSADVAVQTCYGHGNCSFDPKSGVHICVCLSSFVQELNCAQTRWEYFAGTDLAFYTLFAVPMFLVSVLLIPEIAIDVKVRRHISWKTPTRVAKIALLLYMLPRTVYMAYSDIYESASRTAANKLASEILILLWSIGLAITYPLVCIGLKRFRVAIFIILCIIIPLYACLLMVPFGLRGKVKDSSVFVVGSYVVELFYILFLIIGTTYFTVKVYVWAKKGASESQVLRAVANKTVYLTVANAALLALFVILAVRALLGAIPIRGDLATDLFNCATDAISGVAFFLFLQNYFLSKYGFMRAYYLGFTGKLTEGAGRGSTKRKTASDQGPKPRTVESAQRKTTVAANSVPSSGSAFSLNAASSAPSTTASSNNGEYKSRITHSYESSSYIVDSDRSASSSSSQSKEKVTKEEINPNSKELKDSATAPPMPTPMDDTARVSRSFSFELDDSGSQSSFIFNLFKS